MKIMVRFFLLVFLAIAPFVSHASTNYALIVGVSGYPGLDEDFQLKGPRYDAQLVRDFLRHYKPAKFKDENITVLADGVDGAGLPTHAAIVHALQALAQKVKSGDFVYLHFSGHGSQAPAKTDRSETDGLDELFMPRDISHWEDSVGDVPRALRDDEIGSLITAIRNKGAFVWAVFDSCHSGTVTRGAPVGDDVRLRRVDPVKGLGIPEEAMRNARLYAARTRGGPAREGALDRGTHSGKGKFVAFYAAQTTQTTPEMRLPEGEEGRQPHGLFTFTLLRALEQHPTATYRQIGGEVMQEYIRHNRTTRPLIEGDLDEHVFGTRGDEVKPRWALKRERRGIMMGAGRLHDVTKGSILAVLPSAAAASKKLIGYVRVESTDVMHSVVVPVRYKGKKAVSEKDIKPGMVAELVERRVNFELKVARPAVSSRCDSKMSARIDRVLNAGTFKGKKGSGLRIQWVDAGAPADLRLAYCIVAQDGLGKVLDQDHLWLLPPTGELVMSGEERSFSILLRNRSEKEIREALAKDLSQIARVTNLSRLSTLGSGVGEGLDIRIGVQRYGSEDEACSDKPRPSTSLEFFSPADSPVLHPCDRVYLEAHSHASFPIDLNLLYIGADYSVTPIPLTSMSNGVRIEAGRGYPRTPIVDISDSSFGLERMLFIVTEAKGAEVADFSMLRLPALPRSRGVRKGGSRGDDIGALLMDAGFGTSRTRGGMATTRKGAFAITQFRVEVKPEE
ncbi:MAG: caspase family protein [Gammaproteobacteria bacterium]|nr:MAG: caspase family protein [Gammaproteobacteria bacterium]